MAATSASHHIKAVFIILMENRNWTGDGNRDIKGNPDAPYINGTLLPMSSYANAYYNPPHIHPSLPNYLWLEAGTNFGILNDGTPREFEQNTTNHLVTQLDSANISWKAYLEDVTGRTCPLKNRGKLDKGGTPLYAVRHEPFTYFADVTNNLNKHSSYCISHLGRYSDLASDIANDALPQYVWITPNICNDMHDRCSGDPVAYGDKWLSKNVPPILNSDAYRNGGALFITWDEADKGDGPIPMIVLSPFAKGGGYSNTIHYTHGSTLRTFQEIFGVKPLLRDAKKETDLSDLFRAFP
ncbi:MAG TPA: alkaline phosphatase family protein [Rhizomicrobium sp.]|nr:alkaline phosphatase family protein [Rhizomicrobium sp.]